MDEELQVLSATFFITLTSVFHRVNWEACVKVLIVHGCLANCASRSSPSCDRNACSPVDHVDFRLKADCRNSRPSRADRLGGRLSECVGRIKTDEVVSKRVWFSQENIHLRDSPLDDTLRSQRVNYRVILNP